MYKKTTFGKTIARGDENERKEKRNNSRTKSICCSADNRPDCPGFSYIIIRQKNEKNE